MTRYFIPKDTEPTQVGTYARRQDLFAYPDGAPTVASPERFTEVQIVPADAIVIRREELPEVDVWFPGTADENLRTEFTQVTPSRSGPDLIAHLEQEARERLAIVLHLREHPPVDEAQVEALANLLDGTHTSWDSARLARHLVERGARIEVTP